MKKANKTNGITMTKPHFNKYGDMVFPICGTLDPVKKPSKNTIKKKKEKEKEQPNDITKVE